MCGLQYSYGQLLLEYIPDPNQILNTRLLNRPQLQMYPPVALNQYTWVHRTHKQSDKNLLSQNKKYGKKKMLGSYWALTSNPRVPGAAKCKQMQTSSQWRHMYKGKQMKTRFSYMGHIFLAIWGALGGPSMIRLGLSCYPAILSPISMYMWNKEAIW